MFLLPFPPISSDLAEAARPHLINLTTVPAVPLRPGAKRRIQTRDLTLALIIR